MINDQSNEQPAQPGPALQKVAAILYLVQIQYLCTKGQLDALTWQTLLAQGILSAAGQRKWRQQF
jgi:hypothetical protein